MPIEEPAQRFIETARAECTLGASWQFDAWKVTVRTNSEALLTELDDYYKFFRTTDTHADQIVFAWQGDVPELASKWQINHPDPGKSRVKEHYIDVGENRIVRKIQTGVHLAYLGAERVCCGPLTDNPNQVVNFVNNQFLDLLLAEQGELFHAAGVCHGSDGLGLAGQSGKGKSTLALRLVAQGLDLVSNDRLVVHPGAPLSMCGIPKYPRINPGTIVNQEALLPLATEEDLARYRAMPIDDLWELEEKYDAFIEPCFPGSTFRLGASMSMFVLIDWDRHAAGPFELNEVRPADVGNLIDTVMKSPGILLPRAGRRIGRAQRENYAQLLEDTRLFVLSGGVDFDGAAAAIASQLR